MTTQEVECRISQCQSQLEKYKTQLSDIDKELKNIDIDMDSFEKMLDRFMHLVENERQKASGINKSLGIRFALSYSDSMSSYLYGTKYAQARDEIEKGMGQLQEHQEELEDQRRSVKLKIVESQNELARLKNMSVTS